MTDRLKDKVALVIGASRGIGKAIALRFREEGASVVVSDFETKEGRATAEELGGDFIQTDISKLDDAIAADLPHAGTSCQARYHCTECRYLSLATDRDTSPDDWDRVMAVNLQGCFNVARAALTPMKAQGSRRILFTSSITGPHVTGPGHGHYAATKARINGFIRSSALEFSSYGITVNGVEPGTS